MADIDLIKRNIGKMIDQGAPEADIDQYLGEAGVTIDQLKAPKVEAAPSAPITAQGSYNALESGARKAVAGIGGALGDLTNLGAAGIGAGVNLAQRALGMPETPAPDRSGSALNALPTYQSMTDQLKSTYGPVGGQQQTLSDLITGEQPPEYKPGNLLEEVIDRGGEFGPMLFGGAASLPARLVRTFGPALTSKAGGIIARNIDPALEPYGDVAGALVSPAIAAAARRVGTPFPQANAGRQAMADTLTAEGVQGVTAGQKLGNRSLQYAESVLGDFPLAGQKATGAQNTAQAGFTKAALRRIGHTGDDISDAAVGRTVQGIQNEFERLSTTTTMRADNQMSNKINQTLQQHYRQIPSMQKEIVSDTVTELAQKLHQHGGALPGVEYQMLRSKLGQMASSTNDTQYRAALKGIRDALDDAMRRSLPTAERNAWDVVRAKWQNWKTISGLAKETDALGNVKITPAGLKSRAAAKDPEGFAQGRGDFTALARAGSEIMRPLPQSGTSPRTLFTNPVSFLAGQAAQLPLAGRALMSAPVQRYLSNQRFVPPADRRRLQRTLTSLLQFNE